MMNRRPVRNSFDHISDERFSDSDGDDDNNKKHELNKLSIDDTTNVEFKIPIKDDTYENQGKGDGFDLLAEE